MGRITSDLRPNDDVLTGSFDSERSRRNEGHTKQKERSSQPAGKRKGKENYVVEGCSISQA